MYCTKCGKYVEREDALFCPFCGTPLVKETYTQENSYTHHTYQSNSQNYSYQEYPNYQRTVDPYDAPSIGWALLSFLIPIAGLVLYLIWKDTSPLKAKSCLKGFIASVILDVITFICFCGAFSGATGHYYYYTIVSLLKGIL